MSADNPMQDPAWKDVDVGTEVVIVPAGAYLGVPPMVRKVEKKGRIWLVCGGGRRIDRLTGRPEDNGYRAFPSFESFEAERRRLAWRRANATRIQTAVRECRDEAKLKDIAEILGVEIITPDMDKLP